MPSFEARKSSHLRMTVECVVSVVTTECVASRLLQRRLQILDQIVAVFEPDREPDKALADAEFGARFGRQPLMRGGGGMGDEALGVAEIVGDPRDLQRVERAERRRPCRP